MDLDRLPEEVVDSLRQQWPCRDLQLRQLGALLSPRLPSPSTLVAYGSQATGKSSVISSYLASIDIRYVIVQCKECITGRHLLERTVAAVYKSLQADGVNGDHEYRGRCENISALTVHLERMLRGQDKYILVFDGIDKQREAAPTLLPALARLGEFIPNLTTLLIGRHAPPRFLHSPGVPHIHFPPYTRNQTIRILSHEPLDIFSGALPADIDYNAETHAEDKDWLWPRFCAAVWDSLGQACARDLASFRALCAKLWRPFVAPILTGDFGTRDFSRLLVSQRKLFQDENFLQDSIIATHPAQAPPPSTTTSTTTLAKVSKPTSHELPYYAKYILLSAYLASTNPARLDPIYFMKSTERKRRKKGGGTSRAGTGSKPSQNRKLPRHLLAPSPFPLDRLLVILHAVLPHDFRSTIDVYTQIATLASLRLLVRAGGIGGGDVLEPGGKWRVGTMVGWEFIQGIARTLDFGLLDYVAE